MKVFSIVFHDKNGLIFSTDRHNDCWIRLSDKIYGRLTKVHDHTEFIATGSMMKLAELRQESEINPNLIVSIPNVLWRLQEALSICKNMSRTGINSNN
ncbi:hypothetical protein [Gilliamella apicola]|uniref:hypothetical protein n=1 Tax=Gilliamella apicola TaxID=1196095 RepID=UPI00398738A2